MDFNEAKVLLEKYWNCETSLEEEDLLRSYFQQEEIPDELKKYEELFRFFSEEREKELNQDFDDKMMTLVKNRKKHGSQRYLNIMYKVAAAILLVLSFFVIHERFIRVKEQAKKVVVDTFSDPEKALEETKRVLYFVSEKLNKGKEEVSRLNKFKKAEDVVRNSNYKEI
jgi:hypothetical protein